MAQVYKCQESPRPGRRNAGTVRVKRKGNERLVRGEETGQEWEREREREGGRRKRGREGGGRIKGQGRAR